MMGLVSLPPALHALKIIMSYLFVVVPVHVDSDASSGKEYILVEMDKEDFDAEAP